MTRDDHRNRIRPACICHGTRPGANSFRKFGISNRFPDRNRGNALPHALLERGTAEFEREIERLMRIFKITLKSHAGVTGKYALRRHRWNRCRQEIYSGQRILLDTQAESAKGHGQHCLIVGNHAVCYPKAGLIGTGNKKPHSPKSVGFLLEGRAYSAEETSFSRACSFSLIRADLPERSRR